MEKAVNVIINIVRMYGKGAANEFDNERDKNNTGSE
jgi:hypothetical protein